MSKDDVPGLFNVDKIIILVVVIFLLSGEAQNLLNDSGLRWAYLLLLAFCVSYVGTPAFILLAHRFKILDVPGDRKEHHSSTALMGGVAIYVAFALTVLRNFDFSLEMKGVALAGTLIAATGLLDDIRDLPASLKLLIQLVAVGILIKYGVVLSFLPDGFWGTASEWVLTTVWVVGITNAINFMDGLDGLAAGSCAIMIIFFGLVALQNGQTFMVYLSIPLLGACLGFLPYNFRIGRPAHVFLGDAGSTFLGFMLAAIAIMGDWAGDHLVRLIVPVIVLGVPIFDMSFTTIMRVKSGQVRTLRQWIEFTGTDHLHHRLEDLQIGRVGTVVVIYFVTIWLGLSAVALKNATGFIALAQVAQSIIVFLLLSFFMLFVRRKYAEIEKNVRESESDSG
jgi:UDP-GlcNAc:undecaprenyl-phosphate GlcNAc-1-phosphate transferase